MENIAFKKFVPGIAWFIFVMILMFLPGDDIPPTDWLHINYFDKIVHAGIFGLMVILFSWPLLKSELSKRARQQYLLKIALAVTVWGFAAELIQKFWIPGRSYDIIDWIADAAGAFTSFILLKTFFLRSSSS